MRKMFRNLIFCMVFSLAAGFAAVADQRQMLDSSVIRLHVLAASDSVEDQQIKLRVRDAVLESLGEELRNVTDVNLAKQYIREDLPKIRQAAQETLAALGCQDSVSVTLGEMYFDTREYDHFSLPAGIYDALRVTIGEGRGQNWWCVVYPTFCITTQEEFRQVAAGAGFPEALTGALEGEEYEIRFFLLDLLGRLAGRLRNG